MVVEMAYVMVVQSAAQLGLILLFFNLMKEEENKRNEMRHVKLKKRKCANDLYIYHLKYN